MVSAATYNRQALGQIWHLQDLPEAYPGYQILLQGDLDHDFILKPEEMDQIDWIAFSEAVEDFKKQEKLAPPDGKLGPVTLRRLQEFYGITPGPGDILKKLGDLELRPATVPVSEPPGPPLVGRTPGERSVANLWNRYGADIYRQAQANRLPVETALAVFFVESKMAYDPGTGLVIIRFEPHISRESQGYRLLSAAAASRTNGETWSGLMRWIGTRPCCPPATGCPS